MEVILRAAYAAATSTVSALARALPASDRKWMRAISARADVLDRFDAWAAAHRDPSRPLL